jgi:hypothetical protein
MVFNFVKIIKSISSPRTIIPVVGNGYKMALIFTVFHRNPLSHFTGRFFFARNQPSFFHRISIHFWNDGLQRRFSSFFIVYSRFLGPGKVNPLI